MERYRNSPVMHKSVPDECLSPRVERVRSRLQGVQGSVYSRSLKVGNPIASPALFGLSPVSNFIGFTVGLLL